MVPPSFYQRFVFHIMSKKFLESHVSRIFYPIDHYNKTTGKNSILKNPGFFALVKCSITR